MKQLSGVCLQRICIEQATMGEHSLNRGIQTVKREPFKLTETT